MKVFRGFNHPDRAQQCALTIGNFDGVHRGHQAMLALLKNEAAHRGVPSCVMTFEPHPRDFFAKLLNKPELAPARIATLRDKLLELERCGIDQVVVLPFDERLASQSPEDFIQLVLVKGLGVKYLLVGDDFRFTVKAYRGLTDPQMEGAPNPLFLDADYAREAILKPFLEGCGAKAGVWVMQFSPELPRRARFSPADFARGLGEFLKVLQSPIPVAVEIRDSELLTPEYFAALKAHGAVHCVNVHPTGLSVIEQVKRIGHRPEPLVIRWMLQAGFAYEEAREKYMPFDKLVDEDPATRAAVAKLAKRALDAGGTVYVIANNKAEGSAPLTLFKLAAVIAGEG